MEQYTFQLCKVPTTAQAMEQDVAWVGNDNKHLANRTVIISERKFTLKVSNHLNADSISLNSEYRRSLNLSLYDLITVTLVHSSEDNSTNTTHPHNKKRLFFNAIGHTDIIV